MSSAGTPELTPDDIKKGIKVTDLKCTLSKNGQVSEKCNDPGVWMTESPELGHYIITCSVHHHIISKEFKPDKSPNNGTNVLEMLLESFEKTFCNNLHLYTTCKRPQTGK